VHLSKRFIVIGCIAVELAAAITYAFKSKPSPVSYDLGNLSVCRDLRFKDVEGYTWEIAAQRFGVNDFSDHMVAGVTVTSENPNYLDVFADPAHGNVIVTYTSRVIKEGSSFTIYYGEGLAHTSPRIASGSLRTVAID
jgi:hypothetical protein